MQIAVRKTQLWLLLALKSTTLTACLPSWQGRVEFCNGAVKDEAQSARIAHAMHDMSYALELQRPYASSIDVPNPDVCIAGGRRSFAIESSNNGSRVLIVMGEKILPTIPRREWDDALRFLLAHELGHHIGESGTPSEIERHADEFAYDVVGRGSRREAGTAEAMANAAEGLRLLASDLDAKFLVGKLEGRMRKIELAQFCWLAIEARLRESFIRERSLERPVFTTVEQREDAARAVNEEIARRARLQVRAAECRTMLDAASTAEGSTVEGGPDVELDSLNKRAREVEATLLHIDMTPAKATDRRFAGYGSRWRDDATALLHVEVGPWFPIKSGGILAGWSATTLVGLPFLTAKERLPVGKDELPTLETLLVGYGEAGPGLSAENPVQPGSRLRAFRFGVGMMGQRAFGRSRLFRSQRIGFGATYETYESDLQARYRQWTGFLNVELGLGWKFAERARAGLSIGGGLEFDRFIGLYRGEISVSASGSWFLW